LFSALGVTETTNSGLIFFYPTDYKPRLAHHVAFQIVVVYAMKSLTWNIFCMVVDEGGSSCMMSLACWKAIGQSELSMSPTFLTAFDDRYFRPRGIIPSFPLQLEGKKVCVEVEVVDVPLNYNILLGQSLTYALTTVVSMIFQVLCFPHEGQIITVDHLSFSHIDPSSGESMVSMIDNPQLGTINLGVRLFPYLIGTFDYPPPTNDVKFVLVALG
jgi:hypothetical protein